MAVTAAMHIYLQTTPEHGSKSFKDALESTGIGSAVVFIVCAGVVWPVGTLLGYHIRLLALNVTTIEQLRNSARVSLGGGTESAAPNAFSLGKWTRNAAWGACRPAGLSWVEGWKPVHADQRRLLEVSEEEV
ncbi:DHHC palmitoyltransferase family [Rhizoctonia solani]|uniref:DHHC palmitoyltransferase family n=1 Tax=Rhizoctonia solani TaxID=456999 RepID=A0A8H7ILW3_9AGAM